MGPPPRASRGGGPYSGCVTGRTDRAGARPRQAAVGLGDVQPAVGLRALGDQGQVGAVPATTDEQREVGGGPGHPLGRVGRPELPDHPGRTGQLDPELLLRRRQAVRVVAEVAGADAEPRQVADPVGQPAGAPERVGDVLAVAEQLHHAGRGQHARRQRRDQPGHRGSGLHGRERLGRRGALLPPPVHELVRGQLEIGGKGRLHRALEVPLGVGHVGGERVRLPGRQRGQPGHEGQVGDLVFDRPPRSGRGRRPLGVAQAEHQRLDVVAVGGQVVVDGCRTRHGSSR